jgi:hypothetical protein
MITLVFPDKWVVAVVIEPQKSSSNHHKKVAYVIKRVKARNSAYTRTKTWSMFIHLLGNERTSGRGSHRVGFGDGLT